MKLLILLLLLSIANSEWVKAKTVNTIQGKKEPERVDIVKAIPIGSDGKYKSVPLLDTNRHIVSTSTMFDNDKYEFIPLLSVYLLNDDIHTMQDIYTALNLIFDCESTHSEAGVDCGSVISEAHEQGQALLYTGPQNIVEIMADVFGKLGINIKVDAENTNFHDFNLGSHELVQDIDHIDHYHDDFDHPQQDPLHTIDINNHKKPSILEQETGKLLEHTQVDQDVDIDQNIDSEELPPLPSLPHPIPESAYTGEDCKNEHECRFKQIHKQKHNKHGPTVIKVEIGDFIDKKLNKFKQEILEKMH